MSKSSEAISTIYLCLFAMRNVRGQSLSDRYLDKYVPTIPLDKLIMLKKNEKNPKNKDDLDILIARKIRSMEHILAYNSQVLERYLFIIEEINNIDAICILIESKNDKIFEIAYSKYCQYYEEVLNGEDKTEKILMDDNRGKGIVKTKKI